MANDDQRSISIGYIPSNMSYNGEIYDQAQNPYQLWKPGCFPRGEAPPPYEEVIGLSHQSLAEHHHHTPHPMGSTTVSLGTHHRTLPLSICSAEAVAVTGPDYQGFVPQQHHHHHQQQQQQAQPLSGNAAATTTTNLINININNAGQITSMAGENHLQQQGHTNSHAMAITSSPYK